MNTSEITDPLFREAVDLIDAGDVVSLKDLLVANPALVGQRLDVPKEGYFQRPYLLWFIADNPIRNKKLPANIAEVIQLLLQSIQQNAPESFQEQIDYTLGLVATGSVPRDCGVEVNLLISPKESS